MQTKPTTETASCICKSIKITVKDIKSKFSVCHCDTCRSWGGGPYFALNCGTEVNIEGSEHINIFESSSWASRGFCSKCGTHLFYQFKKTGQYNIPVGLFPNLDSLEMDIQFFVDKRPEYYHFSNKTKEMTKEDIMKYFASTT